MPRGRRQRAGIPCRRCGRITPTDCKDDAKRFTSRRSTGRPGAQRRPNRCRCTIPCGWNPRKTSETPPPARLRRGICKRYHLVVDKCRRRDNDVKRFTAPVASTKPEWGCRTEVPGNGPVPSFLGGNINRGYPLGLAAIARGDCIRTSKICRLTPDTRLILVPGGSRSMTRNPSFKIKPVTAAVASALLVSAAGSAIAQSQWKKSSSAAIAAAW